MSVPNLHVPSLVSLGVALSECLKKKKSKRKWSKRWLAEKNYLGVYLLKKLETNEPQDLLNNLRVNNDLFQNLLTLIRLRNEEKKTFMRDAVSEEERLAATTCFSSPVARLSTRGVIPQSGSAAYCDCNSIRDTSPHTLQFSS
jgi:uncharacterized protein VirK/YbjX